MADYLKPVSTDGYIALLAEMNLALKDLIRGQEPGLTTISNQPIGAIRWNQTNANWERWNGTSWLGLVTSYGINITGSAVSSSTAAVGTNSLAIATTAYVIAERGATATLNNKTIPGANITAPTGLVKGDVGLSTVDNTSDAIKPIYPGFNFSTSGGTAEQPASILRSKGTLRVKSDLTWGTTGGASGNVTAATHSHSIDSGTSYVGLGTVTIAYDAAGNITTTTWS